VQTSPGAAMAVMAMISVAVTLVLAPGLRPDRTSPQPGEPSDLPTRAQGKAVQPK
jgi:hypothetical protein